MSGFLTRYNLSPAKFNILLMVRHVGGEKGIAQNELSRLLLVTTSNMTRMIDKIEKDGFAGRLSQKGDRRINLIKITKEGADLLDAIWPHYKKKVDDLIGSTFSKSEKQKINGLLERLIKNIESPA
jgi:DNA-binding MarR family transcriptional regulator